MRVVDAARRLRLEAAAEAVLRGNWREGRRRDGTPYAFTCPAPPRYRHQWFWDSCFHAIVWRRFAPARARAELRTLLKAGRADGFLPHTAFWDRSPGWRRAPLYATPTTFRAMATATIGPPFLVVAWELVAEASRSDDPGFATEALGALRAHLDWLARERDVDGDGLLTIVHPDESGLDDSPQYDPVFGRLAHHRPGYVILVERCRRAGYRARDVVARWETHVEDVLVNVAYALSLQAYARLAGDPAYAERGAEVERALVARSLDPATGLFLDLAGRHERPVRVATWSALAPLALPGVPEPVRRRLVEEHLLDPRRFRAPVGIPSVSMAEPSHNPRFDRFRTWRGPSWMNTAWLLVPPLRALGYGAEADRVVAGLAATVEREGFREYYHPHTGRGMGARRFGWSTLLVELLDG